MVEFQQKIHFRKSDIEDFFFFVAFANFFAVIFPWIVTVPFMTGSGLTTLINWASLCINGFINFSIPLLLYMISVNKSSDVIKESSFQASPTSFQCALILNVIITVGIIIAIVLSIIQAVYPDTPGLSSGANLANQAVGNSTLTSLLPQLSDSIESSNTGFYALTFISGFIVILILLSVCIMLRQRKK